MTEPRPPSAEEEANIRFADERLAWDGETVSTIVPAPRFTSTRREAHHDEMAVHRLLEALDALRAQNAELTAQVAGLREALVGLAEAGGFYASYVKPFTDDTGAPSLQEGVENAKAILADTAAAAAAERRKIAGEERAAIREAVEGLPKLNLAGSAASSKGLDLWYLKRAAVLAILAAREEEQ